jgi:hypothetical protein
MLDGGAKSPFLLMMGGEGNFGAEPCSDKRLHLKL